MTRKHFIALARALNDARPIMHDGTDYYKGWFRCVNAIADVCAQTNARFDRARFLAACGVS